MKIVKSNNVSGFLIDPDDYEAGYRYGAEGSLPPQAVKYPSNCGFMVGYRDGLGDGYIAAYFDSKKDKFLTANLRKQKAEGKLPSRKHCDVCDEVLWDTRT